MIEVDKKEVYRYLGYKKNTELIDKERIDQEIDSCIQDLQKVAAPQINSIRLPVKHFKDRVEVGDISLPYPSLMKNLENCEEAYMFCATIGVEVDRYIKRAEIVSMTRATYYQAIGAALIESVCDTFNRELAQIVEKEGKGLKPRFSPGYGKTPLTLQAEFERLLQMKATCGISLTETYLMVPSKSVTAFIGITNEKKEYKSGCAACGIKECTMRRE